MLARWITVQCWQPVWMSAGRVDKLIDGGGTYECPQGPSTSSVQPRHVKTACDARGALT